MDDQIQVREITPEQANEWLGSRNRRNRHLNDRLVRRYAAAMARGEWQFNADPIRFDENETLLDGQHRLAAIAMTGQTIRCLVVTGLPTGTQDTMDIGKRRTLSDVLALRGESQPAALAGAISTLHSLQTGQWSGADYPTTTQALTMLDEHPGLRDSVVVGQRVYRQTWLSPAVGTALHYHFSNLEIQSDLDAKDFFERLTSGANLEEGSPILTLRRRLEAVHAGDTTPRREVVALVIKAWNAYRAGDPLRLLRWSAGGSRPETFPKAR